MAGLRNRFLSGIRTERVYTRVEMGNIAPLQKRRAVPAAKLIVAKIALSLVDGRERRGLDGTSHLAVRTACRYALTDQRGQVRRLVVIPEVHHVMLVGVALRKLLFHRRTIPSSRQVKANLGRNYFLRRRPCIRSGRLKSMGMPAINRHNLHTLFNIP